MKTILSILTFLFAFLSTAFASEDTMVLGLGHSKEWPVPPSASVSISNGSIVRVKDQWRSLKITGKKIGSTLVKAGSQTLQVSVVSDSVATLQSRFATLLSRGRGLEVALDGKSLVVKGSLLRFSDWIDLSEAASSGEPKWQFEAKLSNDVRTKALQHFKNLLRVAKLPDLSFELEPVASITIPSDSADLKSKVTELFGPYGFRIENNASAVSLEPLVRVQITVAEVHRNFQRTLGLDWPAAIGARLLPQPTQWMGDGVVLNLQMLEQKGIGQILASPTLLCRSGKEAEFFAGGEFPIKIANFRANDVIWKKHGIILKIKPKADFSGRMSIALTTEVSMVDDSTKIDGVPGLLTNRIESHFDLTKPQTIVLSGLIKKEWGNTLKGLPGLTSMPVLGRLFSSRDYRENQTELLVFVTPEIAKESEQ